MPVCKVKVGNTVHDIEYKNDKELFGAIARLEEIFGQEKCGACGSESIKYQVRQASDKKNPNKKYQYYELVCKDTKCGCKFSFGLLNDESNNLYPKTKDGWRKYVKDDQD